MSRPILSLKSLWITTNSNSWYFLRLTVDCDCSVSVLRCHGNDISPVYLQLYIECSLFQVVKASFKHVVNRPLTMLTMLNYPAWSDWATCNIKHTLLQTLVLCRMLFVWSVSSLVSVYKFHRSLIEQSMSGFHALPGKLYDEGPN